MSTTLSLSCTYNIFKFTRHVFKLGPLYVQENSISGFSPAAILHFYIVDATIRSRVITIVYTTHPVLLVGSMVQKLSTIKSEIYYLSTPFFFSVSGMADSLVSLICLVTILAFIGHKERRL
ncbi:hypothetical protein F5Y03DRAFT_370616 [Xylaria venustula]|nr:hypothetical protein F5Y03DRAFT_370616 [Xylaria venustula]